LEVWVEGKSCLRGKKRAAQLVLAWSFIKGGGGGEVCNERSGKKKKKNCLYLQDEPGRTGVTIRGHGPGGKKRGGKKKFFVGWQKGEICGRKVRLAQTDQGGKKKARQQGTDRRLCGKRLFSRREKEQEGRGKRKKTKGGK